MASVLSFSLQRCVWTHKEEEEEKRTLVYIGRVIAVVGLQRGSHRSEYSNEPAPSFVTSLRSAPFEMNK